jgi:hypothetical protein
MIDVKKRFLKFEKKKKGPEALILFQHDKSSTDTSVSAMSAKYIGKIPTVHTYKLKRLPEKRKNNEKFNRYLAFLQIQILKKRIQTTGNATERPTTMMH